MLAFLRRLLKVIPTFILSFLLALAVWISAVTATDPVADHTYPYPVNIELIGQDPSVIITSTLPEQETVILRAPQSIWDRIVNEKVPIRALVDLSGQKPGAITLPVQLQIDVRPIEIISNTPRNVSLTLELKASRSYPVRLIQRGEVAIGFQAETPVLSQQSAAVTGPSSLVSKVQDVIAILDLNQAHENINRTLILQAVDANEQSVSGVAITPDRITVQEAITQQGGYRNVVVKVVTSGQISRGYRITSISVFPPAVTVYSSNPLLVSNMPGYIETSPLDLTGVYDDLDIRQGLNLPTGVQVVGEQNVQVQVGIAAIEGSITISNRKIEIIGLLPGLAAVVSPQTVDVIISGPLPVLDKLVPDDVRVIIDMTNQTIGVYQRMPRVDLRVSGLSVDSILPSSIEVQIITAPTPTPTPRK